jgi:hypothetical protein
LALILLPRGPDTEERARVPEEALLFMLEMVLEEI